MDARKNRFQIVQKKIRFQIAWNRLGMNGNANGMVLLHVKLTTYLCVVHLCSFSLCSLHFKVGSVSMQVLLKTMFAETKSDISVTFFSTGTRFHKYLSYEMFRVVVNLICTTFVGCDTHNTILLF